MADEFQCTRRRQEVTLDYCLEAFSDAHAFEKEDDLCWACPVGAGHRYRIAFGEEPTETDIKTMLSYCGVRESKRGSTKLRKRKYHRTPKDPYSRKSGTEPKPTVRRRKKADRDLS